jgi:alkanesulfonate monooxygenase SsuD/methylene tetrahydromethanopterin reductase-like flavin-dependent oxidoreductase (luciferase family)
VISGFVRGIGCEYFSIDVNPTFSREMFYEAHDLIVRAWTEPGPFEFLGKHYQYRYVNVWPRPYTKPHPPIWLPSAGSSETIEFAAQHRYPYVSVFTPLENVKRLLTAYRTCACEKFQYDPHPSQLGYAPGTYVSDDEQRAKDEAAEHGQFFMRKAFKIPPHFLIPPGYVTENSLRGFLAAGLGQGGPLGDSIAGAPKTVADRLIADYDFLGGFGYIIAGAGPGNATHEQTVKHMTLFQTEVMPVLKKYHAQKNT